MFSARASLLGIVCLCISLSPALLFADLDKSKLDQKNLEEAQKGRLGEEEDSHAKLHEELAKTGQANLKRIAELMEKIQKELAKKQTGAGTQKQQSEVIEQIEKLIETLSKGCSSCSSNSSTSQGSPQKQQQQAKKNQQQNRDKQQAKNEKMEMKPGQQQQGQEQRTPENEKYGPTRNDDVAEGKLPPHKMKKLLDVLRNSDQWGLLPKRLRDEVNNSSGKEFPPEYRDIISKYYKKIAELDSKVSEK